jgi:hypothetical protein
VPERSQRIAQIVECTRVGRVELRDAAERCRGLLRVAALAMQHAESLVSSDEAWLQRDRAREIRDGGIGITGALLEFRPCVMCECVIGVGVQRRLHVRTCRRRVTHTLRAGG